jgi:DNA-binding protein HU-beta
MRLKLLTSTASRDKNSAQGSDPQSSGQCGAVLAAEISGRLGGFMNKADLVDKISAASSISKTSAAEAIDALVDGVTGALKKGERVTLVGFGTFSVSQRRARNGRNPQTGSVIKIAARKVAKFTPGVELKKAVNKSK